MCIMRDDLVAKFVNELRDIAVKHEGCESLRGVLLGVVQKHVNRPQKKMYCPECGAIQVYVTNPMYYHKCTVCGKDYGESKLILR
jgi:transposase-like protein